MRKPGSLLVHQKAHALAVRISGLLDRSFRKRHAVLADQLLRAALSVASNIAEGCGHSSRREFARFLQLALASCAEVAYQLTFGRDTGAIARGVYNELDAANREVRRMLASLLRTVRDELSAQDDDDSVAGLQARRWGGAGGSGGGGESESG